MLARFSPTQWDPFHEMEQLQREIDGLFSRVRVDRGGYPPVRLYRSPDHLILTAQVPGLEPEQVTVSLVGATLSLGLEPPKPSKPVGVVAHRRERTPEPTVRTIELPYAVDAGRIEASTKKGVLLVKMPRTEADKPRAIKVKKA